MAKIEISWEVEGSLTPEDSVSHCIKVIESKSYEDSGTFWTWENKVGFVMDNFMDVLTLDSLGHGDTYFLGHPMYAFLISHSKYCIVSSVKHAYVMVRCFLLQQSQYIWIVTSIKARQESSRHRVDFKSSLRISKSDTTLRIIVS